MAEEKVLVDVRNATKRYGGLTAVNEVSLHLKQGEIVGLIGANGAGKTTLFNLISGTVKCSSGKIILDGEEIQKYPAHKICHKGLARTYQIVQPFTSLTLLENVTAGALMRHPKMKDAREIAENIVKLLKIDHLSGVSGASLTLVQMKRMEVARALATEPKVLLLDEVMAGLNPTEREDLVQMVTDVRDTGVSIIIIEHVMKVIMGISDRVYVLNQGKLIAEGKPEEVVNNPEVIKSYIGEKHNA